MRVPFVDLGPAHRHLRADLMSVFEVVLDTNQFIGGRMVQEFEEDFAAFCETRFCVGVNSGTDALRFALVAAGVRPGDAVVTVPFSFVATTEAISQAGAQFDFVDIDPRTYTMDPEKLSAYLDGRCTRNGQSRRVVSKRTGCPVTAVIPVHLYGQTANMDPILELAAQYDLAVIEDACQAHGAEYFSKRENRWRRAGSMGTAAAFSFYPSKNLGGCGEAGAVTTDDEKVAQSCRLLRDHGQSAKYVHAIEGYNGRLDAIQAGVLHKKLRYLAKWNDQRRDNANRYDELFAASDGALTLPYVPAGSRPVHHLYVVGVANRDGLREELASEGIETGIHYPIPLHLLEAYATQAFRPGDFPIAEHAAARVLSLPMFPELLPEQQVFVTKAIQARFASSGPARRREQA